MGILIRDGTDNRQNSGLPLIARIRENERQRIAVPGGAALSPIHSVKSIQLVELLWSLELMWSMRLVGTTAGFSRPRPAVITGKHALLVGVGHPNARRCDWLARPLRTCSSRISTRTLVLLGGITDQGALRWRHFCGLDSLAESGIG